MFSFRTVVVEQAYRYWSSKCKGDRLPSRADLQPAEMRPLLPYIFLVDVTREPLLFRFRLVGTEICRLAGRDYTGSQVSGEEYGPDWKSIFEVYWRVAQTAQPEVTTQRAPWRDREFLVYERLVAPLSTDGITVDKLFGAIHQLDDAYPC